MDKAIHKIAIDWGLTQATEEAVKAAILTEHRSQHETLYGLINGFTSAAQGLAPDERYTLEVNAGRLLENRLRESSFSDSDTGGSEPVRLIETADKLLPPLSGEQNAVSSTGTGSRSVIPYSGGNNGMGQAVPLHSVESGLFALP
ncbi:MAG: hypothetical protein EOO39_33280 [Cytophagaceae bacterium]|nr:MAG: hypothetical protein EOO39_33280 [Cytophagaceae bacterium]